MASVLQNFLVGIGWKTDDLTKGAREIDRTLSGVKSTVLQVGAAMVGAFGAKALTVDFAKRTDQLNLFSRALGVSASNVQGLGNAFAVAGGDANTAFDVLQKVQDAKDALLVKGQAGFLEDLAYSGIDPQKLMQGKDAYESLLNVMQGFDKLSPERQRTLAQTLGLGPAEIALFKNGRGAVEAQIEMLKKMRPATEDAENAARKLRGEWAIFGIQAGAIADQISVPLVGALGDVTARINDFLETSRPIIDSTIAKAVGVVGDNFLELASAVALIGAGGALSTIGKLARFIPIIGTGLGTLAMMAARLTYVGAAISVGAALWDTKPEDIEKLTGWRPPDWLFTPVGDLINKPQSSTPTSKNTAPQSSVMTRFGGNTQPSAIQTQMAVGTDPFGLPPSVLQQKPPTSKPQPINVHVRSELNGRVIGEEMVSVMNRENTSTLEDLSVTTMR